MTHDAFSFAPGAEPGFASLPEPPYYAVIFASQHTGAEAEAYGAMADRMVELAAQQPGYLGMESTRGAEGFGITVSYWASLEAIASWRRHAEHRIARETGRSRWYRHYTLRVARVERAYAMGHPAHDPGADPVVEPPASGTDPS